MDGIGFYLKLNDEPVLDPQTVREFALISGMKISKVEDGDDANLLLGTFPAWVGNIVDAGGNLTIEIHAGDEDWFFELQESY